MRFSAGAGCPYVLQIVLSLLLWIVTSNPLHAAQRLSDCKPLSDAIPGVLRVAVRPAPPYISEHSIRGLEGISIDLWQRVARDLQLDYQYICLDLNGTLEALNDGSIDIAISPLTISRVREQAFDFSHQYFSSSLVMATRPEAVSFDFSRVLQTMFKIVSSSTFLSVITLFIGITLILAFMSYRYMEHYVPLADDNLRRGFRFRIHLVLMSGLNTLGMRKDVFSFTSMRMQFMFLLVLMVGSLFSSSLGGMVTAAIMSSSTQHSSVNEETLWKYRVSTMKGSTAEHYLNQKLLRAGQLNAQWLRRDSWEEVLEDLVEGRADTVIGDWVQMTWLANQPRFKGRVQINPKTLRLEPHGWAVPAGSELREPVSQYLISVLRDDSWPEVVRGYLGSSQLSAN